MSGAATPGGVEDILNELGFVNIYIERKARSREIIAGFGVPGAEDYVASAYVLARKPTS
ncbi:hypothetical protein [Desulfovibrio aminophilus]|uniref:hypothetical protein n=1 Tax=Desulfovibrio aminophilus TaxID=81425 RepID=UPI0003FF5FAA|nr:hypothetical protein [Desulfovibrio aminophilus]